VRQASKADADDALKRALHIAKEWNEDSRANVL